MSDVGEVELRPLPAPTGPGEQSCRRARGRRCRGCGLVHGVEDRGDARIGVLERRHGAPDCRFARDGERHRAVKARSRRRARGCAWPEDTARMASSGSLACERCDCVDRLRRISGERRECSQRLTCAAPLDIVRRFREYPECAGSVTLGRRVAERSCRRQMSHACDTLDTRDSPQDIAGFWRSVVLRPFAIVPATPSYPGWAMRAGTAKRSRLC